MQEPDPFFRRSLLATVRVRRETDVAALETGNSGVNEETETILANELDGLARAAAAAWNESPLRARTAEDEGELDPDAAWDLLATVQTWAGLASAAVSHVYAPASPWPRNLAGWGKKSVVSLQNVVNTLLGPLKRAVAALQKVGINSWSIGVSFPWGVSISVGS
jgi:hypothetical protein